MLGTDTTSAQNISADEVSKAKSYRVQGKAIYEQLEQDSSDLASTSKGSANQPMTSMSSEHDQGYQSQLAFEK